MTQKSILSVSLLDYNKGQLSGLPRIDDVRRFPIPVPHYAPDVHTRKGKKLGRTKEDFFRDEHQALNPRVPGLFDDLVPQ
ncbi:MAG: hypothetical protein K2M69_05835 [Muribaculaceae bacterium]|nr:hypothetical protein [Muribaculaceae bacterium]